MVDRCQEISAIVRQDILQHLEHLNQSLRRLQQVALSLVRKDPTLARRFEVLLSVRGIAETSALVAVMRKLLHAIHGMFSSQSTFRGEKFYAISP